MVERGHPGGVAETELRHQQRQAGSGLPLDNFLQPERLNDLDRRILKEALRQARKLQERLRLDFRL